MTNLPDIVAEPTTQAWRIRLTALSDWSAEIGQLADAWACATRALALATGEEPPHLLSLAVAAPLLVVDLEATCDDGGRMPRANMEIIEIGAVVVEGDTLEPEPDGEFDTFIRPRRNPRLTAFCTRLTTITQDDIDGAPTFPEAIDALGEFLAFRRPIFCSWGDYDREQLAQDAGHHGVDLPFALRHHVNLKQLFTDRLGVVGTTKKFGTRSALERVGLRFEGVHHRGIDDARNIARLLPWALGWREAPPSPTARPQRSRGR